MQPTLSPKRWRNETGRGNAIDRLAAAFASRGLCFDRRQFGFDLFRICVFQPDDIISRSFSAMMISSNFAWMAAVSRYPHQ
jgi:hypothetical protein